MANTAINPQLRCWYEQDIDYIDGLLLHLQHDSNRYKFLQEERRRRIELLGNSE